MVRLASSVRTWAPFTIRSQRSGTGVTRASSGGARARRGAAAPALENVQVDLDAQARALRRIGVAALDAKRAGQEILGVVEDAAGVAVGPEVRHRDTEVDLRRGADPELGH